jgi:hypothetical protein
MMIDRSSWQSASTVYLRREAISIYDISDLMKQARIWLADHNYVLPMGCDRDVGYFGARQLE